MLASIVTPTDTFRIHISGEEDLEVVLEDGNLRIVGDSGVVVWDQSRWRMRMKRRSMAMRIQRFWRIRIQDKMATRIQSHWKMGVARKKMQEMKDSVPQVHLSEDSTELKEIDYNGQTYLLNTSTKDVIDADDGEKLGTATLDEEGEVQEIDFEVDDDSDDDIDDDSDDSDDDSEDDSDDSDDVPHHEVNAIADHTPKGEGWGSLSEYFTITQSVEERKSKNLTPHGLKRGSRNGNLPGSFWISRSGRVLSNGANVSTGDQSWGAGMMANDYCPTARIIGTHEGKKHGVCQCDRINFI